MPNLHTVTLKPWARRGGAGVFLNHEASRTSNDCYVCEIPAGKTLAPQRQLFEEMILILDGRGSTTVWNDAGARITFEWKAGALFAIPLNCSHQHFNGSGRESGALCRGHQCSDRDQPLRGHRFHLQQPATTSRAASTASPTISAPRASRRASCCRPNFVPDAVNLPLITARERGAGGGHIRFNMARGSMNSHISQFPIGTYKKAHAHGPGAHVIILGGEGFSLMWPEGEEPRRYDWQVGTMIVPPNMWLHQHFNTGSTPARYLAFKHEGVAIRNAQGVPKAWVSRRLGGDQIDYADEPAATRALFARELGPARPRAAHGCGLCGGAVRSSRSEVGVMGRRAGWAPTNDLSSRTASEASRSGTYKSRRGGWPHAPGVMGAGSRFARPA